jgi:Ni/Fe-hydrogenase subunit HybB-like protein
VVAVFLDIGHPFRIWHPAVMWQTKSVMFIVAILVMCYLVVLALECSPTLLAKTGMRKTGELMQNLFFPLALVGTAVAVAHQSALGGIFLIMQPKISPLWYNSDLPLLFLVSAIAIGLSVLSLEAVINSRVFGHDLDKNILIGLARGSITVLVFYMILKISQLGNGEVLALVFSGSLEGNMYLLEMGIGVILPIFMLSSAAILRNTNGILGINILVIVGVLVNRFNVCIFSMHEYGASRGAAYFPSVTELLITFGIISTGLLMFKLAAIHLPVFAEELKTVEEEVLEVEEEVITVTPIEETI